MTREVGDIVAFNGRQEAAVVLMEKVYASRGWRVMFIRSSDEYPRGFQTIMSDQLLNAGTPGFIETSYSSNCVEDWAGRRATTDGGAGAC